LYPHWRNADDRYWCHYVSDSTIKIKKNKKNAPRSICTIFFTYNLSNRACIKKKKFTILYYSRVSVVLYMYFFLFVLRIQGLSARSVLVPFSMLAIYIYILYLSFSFHYILYLFITRNMIYYEKQPWQSNGVCVL